MNPFYERTRPSHDHSLNYQQQQNQSHRSNSNSHRSHEYNNRNTNANSSHRAARDSNDTSDYYGSPTTTKRSLSSHRDYPMSHRSQSTSRMVQRNEQQQQQQHPKHQRSKSTSRLRDFVHPAQEQTMTTNANSTPTVIKPKKNFIADNMLTLGFQLSHPMGYEFDKSLQGISRKINSRTVVPSSLTASLDRFRYNSDSRQNSDDHQVQQHNSTTSGYSSSRTGRSRPLSASSSIQRIKCKSFIVYNNTLKSIQLRHIKIPNTTSITSISAE